MFSNCKLITLMNYVILTSIFFEKCIHDSPNSNPISAHIVIHPHNTILFETGE